MVYQLVNNSLFVIIGTQQTTTILKKCICYAVKDINGNNSHVI